jgi:alkylresorcinol/alkylpyrone synthase
MQIASVGTALPEHEYSQEEIFGALSAIWERSDTFKSRARGLFENVRVKSRHLARPLDTYFTRQGFGDTNDHWIEASLKLGERAIADALARAGLGPHDIDALFVTSVTGICSPSLDARLFNRMGLRPDLKRLPLFGLGCVAGVSGLARAAEYVRAFPEQVAVLLSVELCSLTFQPADLSVANLIATGLFGDGAAAVVVVGEERARHVTCEGPCVVESRSNIYPDTEDVMGWHIGEQGFELVLSEGVPRMAREGLGPDVDRFLQERGLERGDIDRWVCHPGGPAVLAAMQEALGLEHDQVAHSWEVLARQGNLSSVSVLMVLRRTLDEQRPEPGSRGLLLAMGPAFCSEIVLVEW